MPRPLRFEYAGAMYHVINRGNFRNRIFEDDATKASFEKCLFEACEEFGWKLHAYCIMSNHYHLALETPVANLSAGMRWLQGTFGMRFNKFRKEHGHIFQGRFKSIVVEDADRLAWLCHYIHLNPARAGMVEVGDLERHRFSSYRWLREGKKGRPPYLEFGAMLGSCGGLKDGVVGRAKYGEYLAWLSEEESRQKAILFDEMSKGWAHGSEEFKESLLEEGKSALAQRVLQGEVDLEAKELLWDLRLRSCFEILEKGEPDLKKDKKSASWKVAICSYMRSSLGCKVLWLSAKLNMGTAAGVSRSLKRLREGGDPVASKLIRKLRSRVKY